MENDIVYRLQQLIAKSGKDQKDIAKDLKVYESQLSKWATGSTPPRKKTIAKIAKYFGCNYEWLVTGEGPMFVEEIPPKPVRKRLISTVEQGYGAKVEEKPRDAIDMPEMVKMTMVVLDSDSVYRSALATNVRAFYQAVINEGEMNEMREEITAIRKENKEIKDSQERMEEMLRSLGAVQQKRESAA